MAAPEQQSFALSSVQFLSPTLLLRQQEKERAKQRAPTAAAASAMPSMSQQSSSSHDAMPSLSQESSSATNWTDIQFLQTHIRGTLKEICGGLMRMELRIPDEAPIIKQVGPLLGEQERQRAHEELRRELVGYNKQYQCFTNGYGFQLSDRNTVRMCLDADFSEEKGKTALLDAPNLDFVMQRHWGCKKLNADGKWYAYSHNGDGTATWLHEFILNRQGLSLVQFRSNNTKDCRMENMETTKLVQGFVPVDNLIHVKVKQSSRTESGVVLLCYEQSGKRWKFSWKVGEKTVSKMFYNSQYNSSSDQAKEAAIAYREALIAEEKQQLQDNGSYLKAWVHQPGIAAELAQPIACMTGIIKNTFPPTKARNGMMVGPWLRGIIQNHGEKLWCAKTRSGLFVHCPSEADALSELHRLNAISNMSINAFGVSEKDGARLRCILLEDLEQKFPRGSCILSISDDPKIVAAISEHVWKVHIVGMDAEKITNWEAVNVDKENPWQKAQDLITFIKLQDLTNSNGKPMIGKPADFFKIVSIKKRTKMWDCRNSSIECSLVNQEGVREKEKREVEQSKALGMNHSDDRIECIDSLGFMKLAKWTSQANPGDEGQPKHSPLALAAIEAINSETALFDGFKALACAAASSSAAAAPSSMEDDD